MDKIKKDAPQEQESFAELFEQTQVGRHRFKPGQKIEAVIVKITPDWIFLDLGGKSEGYLDKKELLDESGALTVQEGDSITAYFLSSRNNEMLFTTKIATGDAAREYLEDAFHNEIPVEGLIEKEVKGGFEVKIGGSIRAFCPYSQSGMRQPEQPSDAVGKNFSFKVIEYRENGRTIIVSRRKILEEENLKRREELKTSLHPGMTVQGTVTNIKKFGAFVDIGGVEGMIPISEVSWGRTDDIHKELSIGQQVSVVIKELDWEKNRFSFSLKDAQPDPWEAAAQNFPEGSRHSGTVARLTPFGAFITLAPGIDGLLHVSSMGSIKNRRVNNPREVLSEGQTIEVKITAIDREKRRLSLALATEDSSDEQQQSFRQYAQSKTSGSLGTLGEALKAKLGEKKKQ